MIDDNSEILRLLWTIVGFLSSVANDIQWIINIAVLLLIGYLISNRMKRLTATLEDLRNPLPTSSSGKHDDQNKVDGKSSSTSNPDKPEWF